MRRREAIELRESIPTVSWSEFAKRFAWRQGEHVSLVGATGTGKTTLATVLLDHRRWVAALGTKPADDTLDSLVADGYRRIEDWPPPPLYRRVVLWPKFRRPADVPNQRAVFEDALGQMFASGAWCVYVDEAYYIARTLGLDHYLKLMWQMGRSINLSVLAGTQRPAWVPLEMWSQASHLFIFRAADRRDLERVAELGPQEYAAVRAVAPSLDRHEFLYHSLRTGELLRSRVEL